MGCVRSNKSTSNITPVVWCMMQGPSALEPHEKDTRTARAK
eukprot:CAMPEP_0117502430 /NCGR_PEP_ID=MMETSP0784-20121206/23809_1 /TAXON_ID=39447 /ORGANISM="" /LENGTH=40 /DNA_ID= /DNA_START= /DNA_END= /DNA_ORIENTATION=